VGLLIRSVPLLLGALLASQALCPSPAGAEEDTARLGEIQERLEQERRAAEALERENSALRREISQLREAMIEVARQAQDLESELSRTEQDIVELEEREMEKRRQLATRHTQLATTLAGLQRLTLRPPESLLIQPGAPVDAVRSGMVLRVAVPAIEKQAEALRAELGEIEALRSEIDQRRIALQEGTLRLAEKRVELDGLLQQKSQLETEKRRALKLAEERVRQLAGEAKDLEDLVARLEQEQIQRREAQEAAERRAAARRAAEARRKAAQEREAQARREAEAARAAAEAKARDEAAMKAATAESDKASEAQSEEAAPEPTQEAVKPDVETSPEQSAEPSAERLVALPPPLPEERIAKVRRQQAALAMAEQPRPPEIRDFPGQRASLALPVRGSVIGRFGDLDDVAAGTVIKGIRLKTRANAQVVAPFDGKIVYAGPFRGYGLILIIEHGGRYHSLLAGLDRVDAVLGQWVLAGEPVGVMGRPTEGEPSLYFELRRGGDAINPLPWLAMEGNKVRG
jgi:septal ring factor EnvC (AmiA/AmiB activator)